MRWFIAIAAAVLAVAVQGAEPKALADFQWMVGDWRGVGEGEPGTSGSERHNDAYLDGQFIRAQGQSVYPKQEKNPKGEIHSQLAIWSYDKARGAIVVREFDSLGFVGTYILDKAASKPDRWVLVAESVENVPKGLKARYVITRVSDDEYHEVLELDESGKGFQPYVKNRFLKVPS